MHGVRLVNFNSIFIVFVNIFVNVCIHFSKNRVKTLKLNAETGYSSVRRLITTAYLDLSDCVENNSVRQVNVCLLKDVCTEDCQFP